MLDTQWYFVQENNFKAVLESIRDLLNEDTVMPDWLHDIFLGYGDPAQAKYTNMPQDQLLQTIDFKVSISFTYALTKFMHACHMGIDGLYSTLATTLYLGAVLLFR